MDYIKQIGPNFTNGHVNNKSFLWRLALQSCKVSGWYLQRKLLSMFLKARQISTQICLLLQFRRSYYKKGKIIATSPALWSKLNSFVYRSDQTRIALAGSLLHTQLRNYCCLRWHDHSQPEYKDISADRHEVTSEKSWKRHHNGNTRRKFFWSGDNWLRKLASSIHSQLVIEKDLSKGVRAHRQRTSEKLYRLRCEAYRSRRIWQGGIVNFMFFIALAVIKLNK